MKVNEFYREGRIFLNLCPPACKPAALQAADSRAGLRTFNYSWPSNFTDLRGLAHASKQLQLEFGERKCDLVTDFFFYDNQSKKHFEYFL